MVDKKEKLVERKKINKGRRRARSRQVKKRKEKKKMLLILSDLRADYSSLVSSTRAARRAWQP